MLEDKLTRFVILIKHTYPQLVHNGWWFAPLLEPLIVSSVTFDNRQIFYGYNFYFLDLAPMSQRNFPASFWNSSYQPNTSGLCGTSSHHDLALTDPYMTASSLHSMSSLQDPWRYPLSSQTTHPYSHHSAAAMHDLAYSSMAAASSASRFNSHYGSLLPGARLSSQCDLVKHSGADAWSSRYGDTLAASNLSAAAAVAHHDSHLHAGLAGKYVSVWTSEWLPSLQWTGHQLFSCQ